MNPLVKILATLRFVANHPLNRGRKFRAVAEYGFIQVAARLVPGEVCVEFPNRTRLLVSPRMKGAAHFIAPRLNEFNDMAFVMHFLQAGELFADVGANVGAFTVLAAGVAGALARERAEKAAKPPRKVAASLLTKPSQSLRPSLEGSRRTWGGCIAPAIALGKKSAARAGSIPPPPPPPPPSPPPPGAPGEGPG